ncbi:feruloyl esterase B [Xylariales sp. AK1849]|nr:feruloyl esterase B [Xylariales sp. AK1849]
MMKHTNILVFAALATAITVSGSAIKRNGTACSSLKGPDVEGASILSIDSTEDDEICKVQIYLTHTNSSDNVSIITWLPLQNWNGRYEGIGGSRFTAGVSSDELNTPAQAGYVAGTTDAGLPDDSNSTNFANDSQLMKNFAYLSIHDMTVVGKALAEQFYGTPVNYSYWNGCSNGGRQGYMEAQRYPKDYDGIYAASPPLDYTYLQVSRLWPYVVQNVEGEFVDMCIFDTITQAAISQCDLDDGGRDSLLGNPTTCQFNATSMVGLPATSCEGNTTIITSLQAKIWNKIAVGPVDTDGSWLYFGLTKGAPFSSIAGTSPYEDSAGFVQAWVLNNVSYDLSQINYTSFVDIFNLAYEELNDLIGTNDADLSPFKKAGGKLLSWHGWADPIIYTNQTADYWLRVQDALGNDTDVHDFYRLYLAPGVGHCGDGDGATPTDPFDLLVSWVENGTAPDTLPASGNGITRDLCLYPQELQFSDSGNISLAENWNCV